MRKSSIKVGAGLALILSGISALVAASINLSNQIDRVDLQGTSGNLFEVGIVSLGLLGLIVLIGGALLVAVPQR